MTEHRESPCLSDRRSIARSRAISRRRCPFLGHGTNPGPDQFADGRDRLFVAYCDGVPAAAASYVPFARSAFLMGGVVLPAYRGRGLYRALVHARLAHARARGIMLATSHAREATSAPILEKIGFDTVCRFPMYFG